MIEAAPETHWQRVRRHSLRDWGRELAWEYVHSPITSPVIHPKASVWGRGENSSSLLPTGHTSTLWLISRRKGQTLAVSREWNPGHTCVSSVPGCQMPAPWVAKRGQAWLPSFLTKDFTEEGAISWPEEPASPISSVGWLPAQRTPTRPQKRPQRQTQRDVRSRTLLNSCHFKPRSRACIWIVNHSNPGSIRQEQELECGTVSSFLWKEVKKAILM